MLEKLKATAPECLFIDDKIKNLLPARELGMQILEFKDAPSLYEDLIALGIRLGKPARQAKP